MLRRISSSADLDKTKLTMNGILGDIEAMLASTAAGKVSVDSNGEMSVNNLLALPSSTPAAPAVY